ncbi:MAG: hypothetical protein WD354_09730 [Acidimicrobiia bacterium]
MSRRLIGFVLTLVGVVLIVLGVLLLWDSGQPQSTTTTLLAAPTTTTTAPPTTTATTTTTTAAPTTTTLPPETVEAFVATYRAALDADDVEFLFARLHPKVVETQGTELCRAWVEREVLVLDNYQIAGEITGPADERFPAPDGSQFAIADTFSTTVTFTIEGQNFESEAGFALVEGVMHWLGTCS